VTLKQFLPALLLAAAPWGVGAEGTPPPQNFVPLWVHHGEALSEEQLQPMIEAATRREAQPDHVVVLVHGLGNNRETSTATFEQIGARLQSAYQKNQRKALVLGLQWDSDVPMGLFTAESNYLDMVARARQVGHVPTRQLLLRLQQTYPKAHFDIYGHSLGCEVTAAALVPELVYGDEIPKSTAFEPARDILASTTVLAGSDLDYDLWFKSKLVTRDQQRRSKFLWLTMSPYVGERDETLQMRQMVRGVAAGSAFPRMTEQQYDTVFGHQAVAFDNQDIPTDHSMLNYYNDTRLSRVVPMAAHVADPRTPKPKEFQELDQMAAMPNQLQALQPFLDSPNLTTQLYAIWRLEHLYCGGCTHLSDGTLEQLARRLRNQPNTVRPERKNSACKFLQQGCWPTENQLMKAGAPNW